MTRLPAAGVASNNEVTRLTSGKPSSTTELKLVTQKHSSVVPGHPVSLHEQKLLSGAGICSLCQPVNWKVAAVT